MFMLEYQQEREPAEAMAGLRRAMASGFSCGNPVRDEAYRLALSAAVWRLVRFGVEDGVASYSARDLANFSLIGEGSLVEHLARTAYTRAVVEGDLALLKVLTDLGIAAHVQAWHASLDRLDPAAIPAALAGMKGEELHVARLLAARRIPALAEPSWLWDIPVTGDQALPTVAYHLAALQLVTRDDLHDSTTAYLARHRQVLLCRDPDDLLVPLVLRAAETPQTVLAPFAGLYGEPTIVAAAAWHLEHQQPREAWILAHNMRPLSRQADDAWTIAGLAAVELGKLSDAETLRQRILDQAGRDRLLLAIAEAQPEAVPVERLDTAARSCPADHPELFFRLVKAILKRGELARGKAIAEARTSDFASHPQVGPILAQLLSHA